MPHKRAKRSAREKTRSQAGHDLAPGPVSKNTLSNEAIPKGVARVLNAAKVQEDWKRKRKSGSEDDGQPRKKKQKVVDGGANGIKIHPGESITHFNRRVEESMRPLMRDAMHTAASIARKVKKEEEEAKAARKAKNAAKPKDSESNDETEPQRPKSAKTKDPEGADASLKPSVRRERDERDANRPKDFATLSTSAPKRLNDIVQAPPELKKLPRGAQPRQAAQSDGSSSTKPASLRDGLLSMAQKAMLEEERNRVIKAYRELKRQNAGG